MWMLNAKPKSQSVEYVSKRNAPVVMLVKRPRIAANLLRAGVLWRHHALERVMVCSVASVIAASRIWRLPPKNFSATTSLLRG